MHIELITGRRPLTSIWASAPNTASPHTTNKPIGRVYSCNERRYCNTTPPPAAYKTPTIEHVPEKLLLGMHPSGRHPLGFLTHPHYYLLGELCIYDLGKPRNRTGRLIKIIYPPHHSILAALIQSWYKSGKRPGCRARDPSNLFAFTFTPNSPTDFPSTKSQWSRSKNATITSS